MQGGFLSYGLLAALAIALLTAAATDLKRRQIDNWLNLAIAGAAPLYWWASGMGLADAGWQIGLAAMVFAITALLFALRQMGGGDVKLLTALALWFAPGAFVKLCVIMALLGAALSIVAGLRNMELRQAEALRNRLARAAAGIWVLFSIYALYVIAGGAPLPVGATLAAVFGAQALPWILWPLLLIVLFATVAGTRHIIRRQRKRLPIPYGLAISLAGLWLLISGQVPALQAAGLTG